MASPAEPRVKAALFDIDGTLIDTGGAGARSWSWAFERLHGVPADIAMSSSAGMTDPDVAARTFEAVLGRVPSDQELARLFAWYVYRLQHEVAISERYRVLDGVAETLRRLMELGIVLGIVSGGLEGSARIKLERGHLNRYFPVGAFGTDSRDRREITRVAIARVSMMHGRDIEPSDVIVVGDTPLDVDAAKAVGATSLGVASGSYPVDELRRSGADFVLASLEEPFPLSIDHNEP
jgi:phosphoglycolate phosphatase-like HAD superfamily hydrolase